MYSVIHYYIFNNNNNNNIRYIFYLLVASSPKTWDSKPTCPEEQSEEIAVKSQMSQIKQ